MRLDPASEVLPFGDLLMDEVFFTYGFPRLFSSVSPLARVIATCIDEDEDEGTAQFLYLQISQVGYERVRSGQMALRDWIDDEKPTAWLVTWRQTRDGLVATGESCVVQDLADSSLPQKGVVLNRLRKEPESTGNLTELANELPPKVATYLRERGQTTETMRQPAMLAKDYLSFHGCSTVAQYRRIITSMWQSEFGLAARKESDKVELDQHAVQTWLRIGEQTDTFRDAYTFTYDERALRDLLPQLRERCATPDVDLLGEVKAMLATVGVAFIMVAPPSKVPLHGMTRWIDKRVPVIQQTGRRLSDGFIITTLFHEIGHILRDPRGESHLEFKTAKQRNSQSEKNARQFARDVLFGEAGVEAFRGLQRDREIRDKAREVGVAPGVAVWEMHRRTWLPRSFGHNLYVNLGDGIE